MSTRVVLGALVVVILSSNSCVSRGNDEIAQCTAQGGTWVTGTSCNPAHCERGGPGAAPDQATPAGPDPPEEAADPEGDEADPVAGEGDAPSSAP